MARNSPLRKAHEKLGGKMVDFHGWNMPIQYRSIIEEHEAVRNKVGIFDVSHMGQVDVKGEHAMELLDRLTPNDLTGLDDGMVQYSALLNENGGVIDDLLIYCVSGTRYFLCVNAANTSTDVDWLADNALQYPDVQVEDVSREYGMFAVQGPNAEAVMRSVSTIPLADLDYYSFTVGVMDSRNVIISRTGYTGEDGFEIYCSWRETEALWNRIIDRGRRYGIKPVGLGARDTLRMEMRYPLHGQEIDGETTPFEAGLDWIVRLNKKSGFLGREALVKQMEEGVKRKLVGIEMVDRGIPRAGFEIKHEGEKVGQITSGTMSPTLKRPVGLGFVRADIATEGMGIMVDIRGKELKAKVTFEPFVPSSVKKRKIKRAEPAKTE